MNLQNNQDTSIIPFIFLTAKAEKEMPFIKETIEETTQKALKGISKQKVDELFDTLNIIKKNLN